jgi:hypothetical protein
MTSPGWVFGTAKMQQLKLDLTGRVEAAPHVWQFVCGSAHVALTPKPLDRLPADEVIGPIPGF